MLIVLVKPQIHLIMSSQTTHKTVVKCIFKRRILIKKQKYTFLPVGNIITFSRNRINKFTFTQFKKSLKHGITRHAIILAQTVN